MDWHAKALELLGVLKDKQTLNPSDSWSPGADLMTGRASHTPTQLINPDPH